MADAVAMDDLGLAVGDLPRLGDGGAGVAVGVYCAHAPLPSSLTDDNAENEFDETSLSAWMFDLFWSRAVRRATLVQAGFG